MKKKVTSVFASCVAASLIFTAFGGIAIAEESASDESYEEPAYEEPAYEEPAYEEPAYEEPAYEEPAYEEPAPTQRTLVSTNTVYDCDGSGNGYYEYIYSDGSVEYENFYASSGSSSGSSSDTYYDSSSDYYEEEEPVVEETVVEETVTEEAVAEESTEPEYDGIEWTMDQIATIPDVVSGVEDKAYSVNTASKYDIHMDVDFDKDIVDGILFNTSKIDFATAGEYDMNYFVYFNREALLDYIEKNDLNEEDFPGIADETEDRVEIMVSGKVTIQ